MSFANSTATSDSVLSFLYAEILDLKSEAQVSLPLGSTTHFLYHFLLALCLDLSAAHTWGGLIRPKFAFKPSDLAPLALWQGLLDLALALDEALLCSNLFCLIFNSLWLLINNKLTCFLDTSSASLQHASSTFHVSSTFYISFILHASSTFCLAPTSTLLHSFSIFFSLTHHCCPANLTVQTSSLWSVHSPLQMLVRPVHDVKKVIYGGCE